jgi:hypothetical protein
LKAQFILNQKAWVLHHKLSFPWHFFVMNDGSNLTLILPQTICYVICHSICQSYYVGPTCHPFINGYNHGIMATTMEQYVIPTLDSCVTTKTSFDLWMSKFKHNTFVLMVS